MGVEKNKFLLVRPGVILTPIIEPVIISLDKYFAEINIKAQVSSGLRNQEDQLRIIRKYLESKGLKAQFPEAFNKGVNDKIFHEKYKEIYAWQLGWSKLLNIGLIISPPAAAPCLLDYIKNGVNKKGAIIKASPHFNGTCLDISGGGNGIEDELPAIKKALLEKVPGLLDYLIERENNCLHIYCKKI